jgi:hypothetical protein
VREDEDHLGMKLLVGIITLLGFPLMAVAPDGSVASQLFSAISRVENCRKWNNPGCLKFARQKGARRGPKGYAVFKSRAFGERALLRQIERGHGMQVRHFLKKYNPGHPGYVKKVLAFADGLSDTDIL